MAKKKSAATAAAAAESPAATNSPAPAGSTPSAPSPAKGLLRSTRYTAKRSSLHFHERNPRIIDPHAFKKLKKFVKKNGLIGGIGVNRRLASNGFDPSQNNHLVVLGGHQRTRAMDELSDYDPATHANDYEVPIDVIEVTPAQEIEIIVGLNNPGMQGAWDNELLSEILTFPDVDPLATGFDRMELTHMLDSGVLEQIFGDGDSSAGSAASSGSASAESPMLDAFEQIANEARGSGSHGSADSPPAGASPPSGAQPPAPANSHPSITPADGDPLDPNSVAAMKNRRVDYRGGLVESQQATLSNYITLSGTNSAEIDRLLRALSLPLDERFFDLSLFLERLGLDELADSLRDTPSGEDGETGDSSGSSASDAEVDSLI